ncbi:MAG: polymer-forming cytoskeletal protein [Balneolaceae bacterium]|nr:polymer-forming cytoskeletal protein [Balneolaceae bacterium]
MWNTKDSYLFFDKDTAFEGEVTTGLLVLEGVITGDVHASQEVYLKQGSIVQGEIVTQKYKVEDGSVHQGTLKMDRIRPDAPREAVNNGAGKADTPGDPGENITVTLPEKDAEPEEKRTEKRLW